MGRIVLLVFVLAGCLAASAQTPGANDVQVAESGLPESPGAQVFREAAPIEFASAGEAPMQAQTTQVGTLQGTVTDKDDALVPGATVTMTAPDGTTKLTAVSDGSGGYTIRGLKAAASYTLSVSAKGFAAFSLKDVQVGVGQVLSLPIKLELEEVEQTVTAVSAEELAVEQVNAEVTQRVFGVIPNFYVVYDQTFVPLSTKLKYKLAFKASTDVVSFGAAIFIGAINQAAYTPTYVEGMRGFGERIGAAYADATSNIFLGGAIYPALFHQDPRYFYDGIDTKKKRTLHAVLSPFICKGDNGHSQFNISSVLGDLSSGALSNAYYPRQDRGVGLVFSSAAISTLGRVANALAQEFFLSRFTSKTVRQN